MNKVNSIVYLWVGLFVILAVASLFFLALRVSGLLTAQGERYEVKAIFYDSSGLTSKAKVTIAGVVIGFVDSIRLDTQTYTAEVSMEIDRKVVLSSDTGARILTSGVLGARYIELLPGANETLLSNGDIILDTQSAIILENLIMDFINK